MSFAGEFNNIPIIVEAIMSLLMIVFLYEATQQKMNEAFKWIVFSGFAILTQNVGYLAILLSRSEDAAISALKVEYAGAAYSTSLAMMFVLCFFEIKLPKWLRTAIIAENTLVLFSVLFYEHIDLYYKAVYVEVIEKMVRVTSAHGILYKEHVILNAMEILICMFVPIARLIRAETKVEIKKCFYCIAAVSFPGISYVLLMTRRLIIFDTVPAALVITSIVFFCENILAGIFDGQNAAYFGIVENLQNPVITVDKKLRYVCANRCAKELIPEMKKWQIGYPVGEIDDIKIYFPPLLQGGALELEIKGKIFSTTLSKVEDAKRLYGYTIFLKDLTNEKKQMNEMYRLKEEAEEANQAKSDFLSNMSHEIRTPINAIMGMDEMILRVAEDEEVKNYAQNIQGASKTLLSLVNNILDISKIEVGKLELVEDEYLVGEMIKQGYNMVLQRAVDKDLYLKLEIDENIPKKLYGDMFRLNQIIVNILTNAIKYTHQGGIVWSMKKTKELENNQILLEIRVKDTGIGIKEENINQLFEAFQRVDIKKNIHIEGTGLGLSICKRLIEFLDGNIRVESVYGEGSTFIVEIPQIVVDDTAIGDFEEQYIEKKKEHKVHKIRFTAEKAKILVVDDIVMNLMVVKSLLKETKVQVTMAKSGEESLKLAKEEAYDLILMDHMMPGMDGVEAFQKIRQQEDGKNRETPVIVLTANAIVGMKEEYLAQGFDDYLSKPVTGESLEDTLYRYLPTYLIQPFNKEHV